MVDALATLGEPAIDALVAVLRDTAGNTLRRHLAATALALSGSHSAQAAARSWTRWSHDGGESSLHPTSEGVAVYSDAGYRRFVRDAQAAILRTPNVAYSAPELQRLGVDAALRHWPEAVRAAQSESLHAIAIPIWLGHPDGPKIQLTIAFASKPELSDEEIATLLAEPRRPRARSRPAKRI